ncbi:AmmeMemoRadiSam system protein B [Sulfurimonas lithotrophica]|uniref:MEMO1 family protein FJR48_03100 n=1 Tax=Sulfurimonas lithotrophica TaxID=2590022 RepID=A0A5P8NZH6_9BACT|nr:AmmeMemoRadiSam system protein B [Sulfurimonas lithotrophica]QFR48760.1 AmmeMemoRadiSam system protein B [Sulfurimonas lithotrophica]
MTRNMSVSGTFYPSQEKEILKYFEHFSSLIEEISLPSSKAIIVPHAGYIYSGFTANIAYKVLKNSSVKNFLIIGPSHRIGFQRSSICNFEAYDTPFGEIKGDNDIFDELKSKFNISSYYEAHREHSTEVQFPFIKHYIQDASIIELVYSKEDPKELSKLIKYIYEKKDWGVVISTDLSHFYNLEDANSLDAICIDAVKNMDVNSLHKGCEACGIIGIEAMLLSANELNLKSKILDYRTSADASGDNSNVVGYLSACFN